MRHLGLVRLDGISEIDGTRWLLPECVLVVGAPGAYLACLKLTSHTSPHLHLPAHSPPIQDPPPHKNMGLRVLNAVGESCCILKYQPGHKGIQFESWQNNPIFLSGYSSLWWIEVLKVACHTCYTIITYKNVWYNMLHSTIQTAIYKNLHIDRTTLSPWEWREEQPFI